MPKETTTNSSTKKASTAKTKETKTSNTKASTAKTSAKKQATTKSSKKKVGTAKDSTARNNTAKKTTAQNANKTNKNSDAEKIKKSKEVKKAKKTDERVKQIIKEQLENVKSVNVTEETSPENNNREIKKTEKKQKLPVKLDEKEIANKIEQTQKMPKEKKKEICKKLLINLAAFLLICIYCVFLSLGYFNMDSSRLVIGLKLFSLALIAVTIVMFEKAYNKESGELALFGIEALFTAILTLILLYLYIISKEQFVVTIVIYSIIAFVYYTIKSIIIKSIKTKEWRKSISDIKEIMQE